MHEFLLYGQIPNSRHDQVLNILAGVTASQPLAYNEQHFTFAPLKADSAPTNGKRRPQSQVDGPIYYHDLYREASEDHQYWLRVNHEAEPGIQHVLSRSYSQQQIGPEQTAAYEDATRFTQVQPQRLYQGHHFVHGNIVLRVFRIYLMVRPADDGIRASFPSQESCDLLDESGAYVVEASVRLEDRSNGKLSDAATKELLDVKRLLQGAIELYTPARLSLDTRVKNLPPQE